jgi:AmmeMemoRadiSam system protein A
MSLAEAKQDFAPGHRRALLELAVSAIEKGLGGGRLAVRATDYPEPLRAPRATFVTLHVGDALRGCIGTLEARRTLVEDVAHNARAAAFEDPRFPPLARAELGRLDIHISVLSAPEPVAFASEEDLLRQLRPRVDGLILQAGPRRGTFLPSVWEQLPEPREFLRHLKRKAGLPADYWAADIRVSRYVTASIP